MGRTKKPAAAPESAQEARDGLDKGMDISTSGGGSEGAPAGRVVGPEDPAELLGCQEEVEMSEGALTEYSVTAEGGLRLRERPFPNAPVIAVLPWGAGVFADEPPVGEWLPVTTGLLSGYMLAEHLAPLTGALKAAIVHE